MCGHIYWWSCNQCVQTIGGSSCFHLALFHTLISIYWLSPHAYHFLWRHSIPSRWHALVLLPVLPRKCPGFKLAGCHDCRLAGRILAGSCCGRSWSIGQGIKLISNVFQFGTESLTSPCDICKWGSLSDSGTHLGFFLFGDGMSHLSKIILTKFFF